MMNCLYKINNFRKLINQINNQFLLIKREIESLFLTKNIIKLKLDMKSITKLYQLNCSLFGKQIVSLFANVKFTKNHEWVEAIQSNRVRVGITNFAQQQLGEIVHVQLPTLGKSVKDGDSAMTVQSVKMAADVYTPVSGKVVKINEQVTSTPGLINQSAQKIWLFEVQYTKGPAGLLDAVQYQKLTHQSH